MPEATSTEQNYQFWMGGDPKIRYDQTVAQDEERDGDIEWGTIMAYNPTTQIWEPWTNEAATDGTQWPAGILLDTLAEADIQEGNVENVDILVGDAVIRYEDLVFENALTTYTIINVPVGINMPAWRVLKQELGLMWESTDETTEV
jgi:hypothetical protein